jgi:hypothetical protein
MEGGVVTVEQRHIGPERLAAVATPIPYMKRHVWRDIASPAVEMVFDQQ